jgi:hypothetical protein
LLVAKWIASALAAGVVLLAAAPSGAGPAPGPDPLAASGLTPEATGLWEGAGVFVHIAGDISATLLAQTLRENGFRWVAVMTHHGLEPLNENALEHGWLEALRAAGLRVGGWGYNQTEPEAEAALAAELVERFGLEFHIANAELEYKCSGDDGLCSGDIEPAAERFGRSGRFVGAFRARLPDLPAAVSTYGRVDMANLDWGAWREGGFHLLPQSYLNERKMDDPVLSVDGAVQERWALSAVHPTIGAYDGGAGEILIDEYVSRLKEARTTGFSVYLAHHVADQEYQELGEAIETLGIAEPSG